MFLFILESIGTSELILIGIVALIFLGPRRLPEIARKIGKITAEFRGTANEFKETWRREVDIEEESKALDLRSIEAEAGTGAHTSGRTGIDVPDQMPSEPQIKEVDPAVIERLREESHNLSEFDVDSASDVTSDHSLAEPSPSRAADVDDKRNWL